MTNTKLKITGFIFLVVYHIWVFIPNVPIWFRWFEVISAPIFVFCIVEAYIHTKNKSILFVRLYLLSSAMIIITMTIHHIFTFENFYVYQFQSRCIRTLFGICVLLWIIENFRHKQKAVIAVILFNIFMLFISFVLTEQAAPYIVFIIGTFAANATIFGGHFGIWFLLLGVLFYFTRNKKSILTVSYLLFTLVYFLFHRLHIVPRLLYVYDQHFGHYPTGDFLYGIFFNLAMLLFDIWPTFFDSASFGNFAWMITFSLIFILLYNGELKIHSNKIKYTFYLIYPTHIIILYFLGNFIYSLSSHN